MNLSLTSGLRGHARRAACACLASLFLSPPAWAGPPELLLAAPLARAKAPGPAADVRLDAQAALGMAKGEEIRLTLPRLGTLPVAFDRLEQHPDGDLTWVGHFRDFGDDYRVVLTVAGDGTLAGRIASPDGEFSLAPAPGGARLVDRKAAPAAPVLMDEDDAVPVPASMAAQAAPAEAPAGPTPRAPAAGKTTIDLMLLYTPGMAKRYGKGLKTHLNHLVAFTNQTYIDSGVKIKLRLVRAQQVNYSDSAGLRQSLNDLANAAKGFSGVPALRKRYGADLVQMILAPPTQFCGGGRANATTVIAPEFAQSVFFDHGNVVGCDMPEVAMGHELGHNMGAQHDRAHAGSLGDVGPSPSLGYGFGYGIPGKFADIMSSSYIRAPIVAKFSNPYIQCGPDKAPCGIVPGQPGAADSARTLNDNRQAVAAFMPEAGSPRVTLKATPASVKYGGTATLAWSAANATSCAASRGWKGKKALKGKASFTLKATAAFTLTCKGPKGSASATATVKVAAPAVQVSADAGPVGCVFDWLEAKYPKWFPAGDPKKDAGSYDKFSAYRWYPSVQQMLSFIGSSANPLQGHVSRIYSGNRDEELGTLASLMQVSGCK